MQTLPTPVFLFDLDAAEENIKSCMTACKKGGKQLWPMIKTHKSTYIAALQKSLGADGFLCGTLDEAEGIIRAGLGDVMLAYPVMGAENLRRVINIANSGRLIASVDSISNAQALSKVFLAAGQEIEVLLIIDTGIGRLGVLPSEAMPLIRKIAALPALKLFGLSSHPGHAYGVSDKQSFMKIAKEDGDTLHSLRTQANAELSLNLVTASGCTPTFAYSASHPGIDIMRPGVNIIYDMVQVSMGVAGIENCALTVQATVISKHPGRLIIDCGAKCLGLDKGAHGISSVKSFGHIIGHEELTLAALSEEVGRVEFEGETSLNTGDTVRIIPNHVCSAINSTSFLVGLRGGKPCEIIEIDLRGNSKKPEPGRQSR